MLISRTNVTYYFQNAMQCRKRKRKHDLATRLVAGLEIFRDTQTSQLRHWVSNMSKYKLNEKCLKRKKRKKGEKPKTKTKERRVLRIADCNETKTNGSIKEFVSSEKMSQGELWQKELTGIIFFKDKMHKFS